MYWRHSKLKFFFFNYFFFKPPNCPKINPQDYLPNSIINPNVNPTEVIGTYNQPFTSIIDQSPTEFLSTIPMQQYPSQLSSLMVNFINV